MKMEVGKVNVLHVTTDPKKFKNTSTTITYAYLTTATETEFKELLNNFLSEYEINDDSKFNPGVFTEYVAKNGYYIHTRKDKVFSPIP